MPRKPQPKPDNPEQFKRFLDAARESEAGEPSKDFDRVLERVARSKPTNEKQSRERKE